MDRDKTKTGFTFVEILVVLSILGILAVIAIPKFQTYRNQSYCAGVKSDLGNLAIAQEANFADTETYLLTTQTGQQSNVPGFAWFTDGIVLDAATGDANGWSATVSHPQCEESPITYDNQAGGFI